MSPRFYNRRTRAVPCRDWIEELEDRTLLSITANPFTVNELENTVSTIELSPFVKDSDPTATLTFALKSPTTTDGGQVSVDAALGLVGYTPAPNSSSPDTFQYFASDSDSSATETVTLNLSSVAANPVVVSEVEGQSTIDLTILNLPAAVQDTVSKPSYTFSNVQVVNGGDGTVSLTDTKDGAFTYTPPSSTFTGDVTISYQVDDGAGTSNSTVEIDVGPIAADPVTWGTLASTNTSSPTTTVPSLVNRIHDVNTKPSYIFSNPIVAAGDGTISSLNPATGSFTYTAPDAMFTGVVAVQYTVSDGTNATTGDVSIVVAALVTQPVVVTELDHQSTVSLTILNLTGAVQDSSASATYTFFNLRVVDGGGSVPATGFDDSSVGALTYTLPINATPRPVHIGYSVSDGTNTANGIVTIQLVGIVANPANFSILQNTQSTLTTLEGRVIDVESSPTFTFSSPSVPAGDGTVKFTDTAQGIITYTPPTASFTGTFPIQYTVGDGTYSTSAVLNLTVAPLITRPLLIPVALQTQPTTVPSLVASGNVEDISANPSYTFSKVTVAPGDGTVKLTDVTTGAFIYTPPSASFFGVVQVAYTVTDGASNTASGNVIINVEETIQPQNDGPIVAVAGTPLTISADVLLRNDVAAPNGLKLRIGSVGSAMNGTVILNSAGSVTFTPTVKGPASFTYTDTDADSDASTVATVKLDAKLGSTIHWADPAAIVYGTALGTAQLDSTASVPGTFAYGPVAGTILNAGDGQKLVVTFTPTDSADYADATATVRINVLQVTTIINWASPGNIVYDTALTGAQLDATANVPGTFTYIPAVGTVLPVGTGQTLAVVFTPFDATDYTAGYATATINVEPVPPPGLTVQTHSFSGRIKHKVGGVIAQLHTTLSKLKTSYYSALVNWDDGVVQKGKLAKSGTHGFKLNATHNYRVAGKYDVSVTISDPFDDSLTESFFVFIH
jgi:Bacterial Ig domain/Cadherin-like domain